MTKLEIKKRLARCSKQTLVEIMSIFIGMDSNRNKREKFLKDVAEYDWKVRLKAKYEKAKKHGVGFVGVSSK